MAKRKPKAVKNYASDTQDILAKRIEECERVIQHLDECPAWKVIVQDLTLQKQMLDDNWQDIPEGEKLSKARELKYAYVHLLTIKSKYEKDLENSKIELDKLQNTDTAMVKDYDLQ